MVFPWRRRRFLPLVAGVDAPHISLGERPHRARRHRRLRRSCCRRSLSSSREPPSVATIARHPQGPRADRGASGRPEPLTGGARESFPWCRRDRSTMVSLSTRRNTVIIRRSNRRCISRDASSKSRLDSDSPSAWSLVTEYDGSRREHASSMRVITLAGKCSRTASRREARQATRSRATKA